MKDKENNSNEKYRKMAKILSGEDHSFDGKKLSDETYNDYLQTWEKLEEMNKLEEFDANAAWKNLSNRLEKDKLIENRQTKLVKFKRNMAIAASLLIILSLTFVVRQYLHKDGQLVSNNNESFKSVYLPDGSLVSLNKNASITFPAAFNEESRNVELKGEAFFEIKRNTNQPFIVHVGDAQVIVLGTSFNVNSANNKTITVTVNSGKVKFCDCAEQNNSIILESGDKGVLKHNKLIKQKNDRPNYLAWKNKKLRFKSTSLNDVVSDINATYHANITIQDEKIADMLITTTFDSLSVEEILESLSLTLDIEVKQPGKNAILVK